MHPLYEAPDYLDQIKTIDVATIRTLRQQRQSTLWEPRMQPFADAVKSVAEVSSEFIDYSGSVIRAGRREELDDAQAARYNAALQTFCPWKKGPFELFGTHIDAEWRSDWKWERIEAHCQPLTGRKIADIGCHNGYFMFRMLEQNPDLVVGIEPVAKHWWNFQLIQNLVRSPKLYFELLGVEHMDLYPGFFDTIFCLGILYHHTDPVGLLRKMREALAPRGEIIIDCQGIPGTDPVALTPRSRYAKARGIWFLPTQSCLEHWITRAGFTKVKCFYGEPLSVEEQRRTDWADVDSLAEFLDPSNPTKTVEGYPAPWRFYVRAQKG